MAIQTLPDGTIMETFINEAEYKARLNKLYSTMGRHKLFYQGWLNGQLTIMYRG